jgi:hypothetical protein
MNTDVLCVDPQIAQMSADWVSQRGLSDGAVLQIGGSILRPTTVRGSTEAALYDDR